VAEHFTPLNLTSIQFAALVAINDSPGLDATRLAALIDYDRPTMTGVIDRLEARARDARGRPERPARPPALPDTGRFARAEAADRAAHESRDVLLGPLPPEERRQFMQLLESWSCTRAGIRRACRPSSQGSRRQ
jgi:hypothetical protein